MYYSIPGSFVHGIFQARVLEWAAISFSRGSSLSSDQAWVSCIVGRCFTTWASREVLGRIRRYEQLTGTVSLLSLLFCHKVMSNSATPWTVACQAPLSSTISQSLLKFMFIESLMLSNHLILCHPFFCLQSFPASDSFSMSWLFESSGQSIGASASVLPMNIQGWFPLELTGLISLLSKRLSRVFLQHHNSKASILWRSAFFMVQLSHPYMTARKTIVLPIWIFVSKLMSLLLNTLSRCVAEERICELQERTEKKSRLKHRAERIKNTETNRGDRYDSMKRASYLFNWSPRRRRERMKQK